MFWGFNAWKLLAHDRVAGLSPLGDQAREMVWGVTGPWNDYDCELGRHHSNDKEKLCTVMIVPEACHTPNPVVWPKLLLTASANAWMHQSLKTFLQNLSSLLRLLLLQFRLVSLMSLDEDMGNGAGKRSWLVMSSRHCL